MLKVADAMLLLGKLGAPASEVFGWAVSNPIMEQARTSAQATKRALKAHYDNEAWLEIARSIADQLREGQREAPRSSSDSLRREARVAPQRSSWTMTSS